MITVTCEVPEYSYAYVPQANARKLLVKNDSCHIVTVTLDGITIRVYGHDLIMAVQNAMKAGD